MNSIKKIITLLILIAGFTGFSQEAETVYMPNEIDELPQSSTSLNDFKRCLMINFRTPEVEQGGTFNLELSFVVEKDGKLTEPKLVNDPGYGFNEAAVKVFSICAPKQRWSAGKLKGKTVRTRIVVPLTFKIS